MKANQNPGRSEQPVPEGLATQRVGNAIAAPPFSHPFLKGLDVHQCRVLADCAMLAKFRPGELIFREGEPANRFYLITQGKVQLESRAQHRRPVPIQTVEAGDVLGWSWMFEPYTWNFDARAVESTDVIFFYATPLRV